MQRILNSKSLRILQINRLNNNKIKLIRTMASKISEAEWKEKLTPKEFQVLRLKVFEIKTFTFVFFFLT